MCGLGVSRTQLALGKLTIGFSPATTQYDNESPDPDKL